MEVTQDDLLKYCETHTSPEPELLKKLNRFTHLKMLQPRMLSGHFQGRLLSLLSKLKQPKSALEIGTFTGYSALCIAEGLHEEGRLTTIEANPEYEDIIRGFVQEAGLEKKIRLIIGDGFQIVRTLPEQFDLIFLDADKANYPGYYELLVERLNPGGLLLADNVLWSGKVTQQEELNSDRDTQLIHAFNEKVHNDARVECLLLPVRDGLMLVRRK